MKRTIVALLLVMSLGLVARAEETPGAYIHFGQIDFTYPIAHVTATPWLWDFLNSRASMAAETTLVTFPRRDMPLNIFNTSFLVPKNTMTLSAGAQTSEQARFTPIASFGIDFGKIITNAPTALTNFGIWFGHSCNPDNPNRSRIITDAGIKASVPLW